MLDIERFMSEGQIGATISALDRLIPGLGGIARQSAAPSLVAALGQRTVLEGKPAVAFPVRFVDGRSFWGRFRSRKYPPCSSPGFDAWNGRAIEALFCRA